MWDRFWEHFGACAMGGVLLTRICHLILVNKTPPNAHAMEYFQAPDLLIAYALIAKQFVLNGLKMLLLLLFDVIIYQSQLDTNLLPVVYTNRVLFLQLDVPRISVPQPPRPPKKQNRLQQSLFNPTTLAA